MMWWEACACGREWLVGDVCVVGFFIFPDDKRTLPSTFARKRRCAYSHITRTHANMFLRLSLIHTYIGWLKHIRDVLSATATIARKLHARGQSCVVHCRSVGNDHGHGKCSFVMHGSVCVRERVM